MTAKGFGTLLEMNEKEIAFIICTNDDEQYEDCLYYINRLIIPENFSMDVICIKEASGICEAYNAGMKSSDAKYKIYMHHDVLILNQNFLVDMIACFDRNPKAGLLGLIGRKNFDNRDKLFMNEYFGALYETRVNKTVSYFNYSCEGKDEKVLHVDGLLIMTSVDIEWREDIFDRWDCYDVSQSLEMARKDYEVYVPYAKEPWALHDCGALHLNGYYEQRDKLIKEYSEYFP